MSVADIHQFADKLKAYKTRTNRSHTATQLTSMIGENMRNQIDSALVHYEAEILGEEESIEADNWLEWEDRLSVVKSISRSDSQSCPFDEEMKTIQTQTQRVI
jgi:hypothetical protein